MQKNRFQSGLDDCVSSSEWALCCGPLRVWFIQLDWGGTLRAVLCHSCAVGPIRAVYMLYTSAVCFCNYATLGGA